MFIPDTSLVARADLTPNDFQRNTIIGACIMIVAAAAAWNLPIVRDILCGVKMMVIGTHELFHLFTGWILGGWLDSICIDPAIGARIERQHENPALPQPFIYNARAITALVAGYFGSAAIGFVYIFASFDIVGSKIASFTIAIGLLLPLVRAEHWSVYASILATEGVLIGLWFGSHGAALRFLVMFIGVLNLFYALWDYCDEQLWDKHNPSDCTELSLMVGYTPGTWAVIWVTIESLMFACAIIAGMVAFNKSTERMYQDATGAGTGFSWERVQKLAGN